jgi:hypothetical protein
MSNKNLVLFSFLLMINPARAALDLHSTDHFLKQCQSLEPIDAIYHDADSGLDNINRLEPQINHLFSLIAMGRWHRHHIQFDYLKKALWTCQKKLYQYQDQTLANLQKNQWVEKMNASREPRVQLYQKALYRALKNHRSLHEKKTFKQQALKYQRQVQESRQQLAIEPQCQLPNSPSTQSKHFIWSYLLQQDNVNCRKNVWYDWQQPQTKAIQLAKQEVWQHYQALVENEEFKNIAQFQLQFHYLHQTAWVSFFLNQFNQKIIEEPWNIKQNISTFKMKAYRRLQAINSRLWLVQVINKLGLRLDKVATDHWRLWHQKRILGELYLEPSKHIKSIPIQASVAGFQYGIHAIQLPEEVQYIDQKRRLIQALGLSLSRLATTQEYNLLQMYGTPEDLNKVGIFWLMDTFAPYPKMWHDVDLVKTKLSIWRSQAALDLTTASVSQLAEPSFEFLQLPLGATYYQDIWQRQLAVFLDQKFCTSTEAMFQILFEKSMTEVIKRSRQQQSMLSFIEKVLSPPYQCQRDSATEI